MPNRVALLDGYLGWDILPQGNAGFRGEIISWSGKPHVNNDSGQSLYHCLLALNARGVAVEFYYLTNGPTSMLGSFLFSRITEVAVFVTIVPDYRRANSSYNIVADGHGAVRLWYHASIAFPPAQEGAPSGGASASLIRELKGQRFMHVEGITTFSPVDDVFVLVASG